MNSTLVAVVIFGGVLWVISMCYYFYIPDTIGGVYGKGVDNEGYWGDIDAEFNWCEYNYHDSFYIAEPCNVITSLMFCIVALVMHFQYCHLGWSSISDVITINVWFGIVGVGSVLFHSTLRYPMQLLDELPMFYLSSLTSISLYFRDPNIYPKNKDTSHTINLVKIIMTVCTVILTLVLFLTEKENNDWHSTARGFMSLIFSLQFLYVFVGGANAAHETDCILKNKITTGYLRKSFASYGLGLVCWLLDNFFCDSLRALPFGIPYLQLHAFGWHIGCVFGHYYYTRTIVWHRLIVRLGYKKENVKLDSFVGGLLYHFSISEKNE